jgi:hypothetical protein
MTDIGMSGDVAAETAAIRYALDEANSIQSECPAC